MSILFQYRTENLIMHHSRDELPPVPSSNVHDMHELYYFIAGRGQYCVEGNAYPLTPGCVILIRAGEAHFAQIAPEPYERAVIHFRKLFFSKLDPEGLLTEPFTARPLGKRNLYTPERLNQTLIRSCFDNMCKAPQEAHLGIICHLPLILYELRRCFGGHAPELDAESADLIGQVIVYINEHLTESFQLPSLAKRFFINEATLNRKFKEVTGATIWQYTLQKRLFLARQRIAEGVPPTRAAADCGWNDYSAFYRQYKSQFGLSPRAERASM